MIFLNATSRVAKVRASGGLFISVDRLLVLLLAPRFINGQIVAKTKSGGIIPYRGTEMQVRQEGRTLKYQSNEDGYWSIPIVSRFPELVRIQVYNQDESAWFETKIEAVDVWKDLEQRISHNSPVRPARLAYRTHSACGGFGRGRYQPDV